MKRPDMLRDPIAPALARLVLPLIPGTLSIVLFNLADTYFVGQLGADPLAAMSFSFPIVLVSGGLSMGLGIGTSALVSRKIGSGDERGAAMISSHAHLLVLLVTSLLAVIGLLTIEPLFRALGAGSRTLPLIRDYMRVWYMGLPFVLVPMIGMNVLQARGDTRVPGAALTGAVFLNILLDPLLIFGWGPVPAMGIAGAAWATVIGRASSAVVILLVVWRRDRMLTRAIGGLRVVVRSWAGILRLGVPAAAANILLPISMGVITRLVSAFGTDAVAGFGAATRVESFALVFTLALSMIVTPYVGQNAGAGKGPRVRTGFRVSAVFSLAWGGMVLVVFLAAARVIAGAFSDSAAVTDGATAYLRTVALSYGLLGIVNLGTAAFNGLQKPLRAAGVAALRLFVLLIPLAWLGRELGGLQGLYWGVATGNVLAGVASFIWFDRSARRMLGASPEKPPTVLSA